MAGGEVVLRGSAAVPERDGVRWGVARSPGHHGEILQGCFRVRGQAVRALVTMPCPPLRSEVAVALRPEPDAALEVHPTWKRKALRAVEVTLDAFGLSGFSGDVVVSSNIRPCDGCGSSTADVTAAIKAVGDAFGRSPSAGTVARLAVVAEEASDATAWAEPVLFAHREGRLLERLARAWPAMRVLAFHTAPGSAGVETLAHPPARYDDAELAEFGVLRVALRDGLRRGDVTAIGAVASASAGLNQRHLPVPRFEDLLQLGREHGAAGMQVAHSGSVAGYLFDGTRLRRERIAAARSRLEALGLRAWTFDVGRTPWPP